MTSKDSINLPTRFYYQKKWHDGWLNITAIYRSVMVCGVPGSGKSYAVINNIIKQQIEKGFSMLLYDYKHPDLSQIAYNHLRTHLGSYDKPPKFHVLDFDNPRKSNRCNPLYHKYLEDISDAYESSYVILLNLNKTWAEKQGDFFTESAFTLLSSIIWFLKIYKGGRYCTFPHCIELLCQPYTDVFTILASYPDLASYMSPFIDAMKSGAQDQLQGQLSSVKIPLLRIISPQLYWVMSGNDFPLTINDPDHPAVLCIGSNPNRQNIYSCALGLYCQRIIKLINRKNRLKCSVVLDELPTLYIKGLDGLIATARSNKVAVCLGIQDFSQLTRDYGEKESQVIRNTVGNMISGQVLGPSAKELSERFGKILQERKSFSVNPDSRSTSVNTQMDELIPASKIGTLSQGWFVGAVADNYEDKIQQKIFHAEIVVDHAKVKAETEHYVPMPDMADFRDAAGKDRMEQVIQANYDRIKSEAAELVKTEIKRIKDEAVTKQKK